MRRVIIEVDSRPKPMAPMVSYLRKEGKQFKRLPGVFTANVTDEQVSKLRSIPGIKVHPDVKLMPLGRPRPLKGFTTASGKAAGLNEVLTRIRARKAWIRTRGKETYIAIIDTGISGVLAELPKWKQADGWSFDGSDPWDDYLGHGSMCAVIAAGVNGAKARFDGVAPDAHLYSCKTEFYTSELIDIYDWLIDRREQHGKPIIANNSYGLETCTDPEEEGLPILISHPFVQKLKQAIQSGITVVFAAGNNHDMCEGKPKACTPDTIWAWNSLPEVISVGTVDENDEPWYYSSRGPGQWSGKGAKPPKSKPDCVAPTYGWIVWGSKYGDSATGWGTSGAAPQVAGLCSLIHSATPKISPSEVHKKILKTCSSLPFPAPCVGAGVINCDHATL